MSAGVRGTGQLSAARFACLLETVALLPFLAGCPFPIPGGVDREIREETIQQIKPGASTRADVLLSLGDPEQRIENDSAFVYSWTQRAGGVGFIGPLYGFPIGGASGRSCHALAIRFAPDGGVTQVKVFHGETTVHGALVVVPGIQTEMPVLSCAATKFSGEIRNWLAEPTNGTP